MVAGFTLGLKGVEIDGQPTVEEWRAALQFVDVAASASMWWYGDLLRYGDVTYGELASAEEGDGKYEQQTLYDAKYVAENIPISFRNENLSFAHHRAVAPLPRRKQTAWLAKAESESLSVAALRRAVADERAAETIDNIRVDLRLVRRDFAVGGKGVPVER